MFGLSKLSYIYGVPVQTHLSESINEIEMVLQLHTECQTYTDVYKKYGLLHEYSLLGHAIYCSDEEMTTLHDTKSAVIHCASSNFLLGSGIMDVRRYLNRGIKLGLGTDVAGGASASMVDCIRNTIVASRAKGFQIRGCNDKYNEQQQVQTDNTATSVDMKDIDADIIGSTLIDNSVATSTYYNHLTTLEAFYLATQGGAEAVGMGNVFGNFLPGLCNIIYNRL
jgi:guanine deaminase